MLKGLITRQVFVVIDVALAVLILVVAWMVVKRLMPEAPSVTSDTPAAAEQAAPELGGVKDRSEYQIIVANGLFGEAGRTRATEPVEEPKVEEPKVTVQAPSFPMRLVGTSFATTHPNAIVEHQGRTGVYKPGDEIIPNTIRLDEVHNRWVYLYNISKQQREILTMDAQADSDDPVQMASASPRLSTNSRPRPMRPNEVPVSREEVEMELVSITNNLAEVHNTLNPRPYEDATGKVIGMTADNITSIPLAQKLGFQEGDVLTHINGMAIDSQEKITEALGRFQNANTFRVTVLRNGKPELLNLRLTE